MMLVLTSIFSHKLMDIMEQIKLIFSYLQGIIPNLCSKPWSYLMYLCICLHMQESSTWAGVKSGLEEVINQFMLRA